jgi:hypothetical protein
MLSSQCAAVYVEPTTISNPMIHSFVEDMQQRLVFLHHSCNCPASNSLVPSPCRVFRNCKATLELLKHVQICRAQEGACLYADCDQTKILLSHHEACVDNSCYMCKPLRDAKKRKNNRTKNIISFLGERRGCNQSSGSDSVNSAVSSASGIEDINSVAAVSSERKRSQVPPLPLQSNVSFVEEHHIMQCSVKRQCLETTLPSFLVSRESIQQSSAIPCYLYPLHRKVQYAVHLSLGQHDAPQAYPQSNLLPAAANLVDHCPKHSCNYLPMEKVDVIQFPVYVEYNESPRSINDVIAESSRQVKPPQSQDLPMTGIEERDDVILKEIVSDLLDINDPFAATTADIMFSSSFVNI